MLYLLAVALLWVPIIHGQVEPPEVPIVSPFPGDSCVDEALAIAIPKVEAAFNHSCELLMNETNSPAHILKLERFPSPAAIKLGKAEEIYELTIQLIIDKFNDTDDFTGKITDLLSPEALEKISAAAGCFGERAEVDCSDWCFHSQYRTLDGSCNNLANPLWGASLTGFNRLLPAVYENGFNIPKGWIPGKLHFGFPLPSARLVSIQLVSAPHVNLDCKYTHMLMQWGQFLDHDMDLAPTNPIDIGVESGIPCADNCENDMPCFPIPIPECDPRVKTIKCFGFTRSAAICGSGHSDVAREQLNELTSYIDGSNVYGSSPDHLERLRSDTNPIFLRWGVELPNGKYLLPPDDDGNFAACDIDPAYKDTPCFLAGDKRANEQLGLTAMHTIWFREHNRIAKALKLINPHWDDERIFQTARKIVGAQMQRITYVEWLPKLIGMTGMERIGPYVGYVPTVNSGISGIFATAAYRVGHALINPIIKRLNKGFNEIPEGNLNLHEAFFSPHRLLYEGGIDPVLRGYYYTAAKEPDPKKMMNDEVTEKLFKLAFQIAMDLASLNIQRGRDHGLPTYTEVRKYCGLSDATTFDDLRGEIRKRKLRKLLKGVYGDARNIDLFVGGLSEDILHGARVGPTFLCILVEQFRRLRDGDRFYYENPGVFNSDQLAQIRKASLARIICNNGDDIDQVQPDAFRLISRKYGLASCSDLTSIPEVDLSAWKDGGCDGYPVITDQSNSFNSSTQICCCGNIFTTEGPASTSPFQCCGAQLFDPASDTCCEQTLYCGRPQALHQCCGKYIYNPASEECVNGFVTEASKTRACGSSTYHTLSEICCGGNVFSRGRGGNTCCGPNAYDPFDQICCSGVVNNIQGRFTRCCGAGTYEADKDVCCVAADDPDNYVRPRPRGADNKDKHGNQMDQCTSLNDLASFVNYIYVQDGCCCGQVLRMRPLLQEESCCGDKPYNIWNEMCCDNTVVPGNPKVMRCCGTLAYDPSKQSCCETGSGRFLAECVGGCPISSTGICNSVPYNVETELCCNGAVKPGGPNIACCGDDTFDASTTNCCLDGNCKILTNNISAINDSGVCTLGG